VTCCQGTELEHLEASCAHSLSLWLKFLATKLQVAWINAGLPGVARRWVASKGKGKGFPGCDMDGGRGISESLHLDCLSHD
jgi:hypothetical protein